MLKSTPVPTSPCLERTERYDKNNVQYHTLYQVCSTAKPRDTIEPVLPDKQKETVSQKKNASTYRGIGPLPRTPAWVPSHRHLTDTPPTGWLHNGRINHGGHHGSVRDAMGASCRRRGDTVGAPLKTRRGPTRKKTEHLTDTRWAYT